jgi:hypothetical protein
MGEDGAFGKTDFSQRKKQLVTNLSFLFVTQNLA